MKILILLTGLVFAHISIAATLSYNGGADGGGGDAYALDFVSKANVVSTFLKAHPNSAIDQKLFEQAILITTVESTDQTLVLNNVEKDAINYPDQKKILLNRTRWYSAGKEETQIRLVIHEYLGIMKIDDTNYKVSSKYNDEMFSVCNYCYQLNPSTIQIGTKCKTSKDIIVKFIAAGNGEWPNGVSGTAVWKDLATGLTWHGFPPELYGYNQYEAITHCLYGNSQFPNFHAPSRAEILQADDDGLFEVFGMGGFPFWSSTLNEADKTGYLFRKGYSGKIEFSLSRYWYGYNDEGLGPSYGKFAPVCVGRPHK